MTVQKSWRALIDDMAATLAEAQTRRHERQNIVEGPNGLSELAWAGYERQVMLDRINTHRALARLRPVAMDAVVHADQAAAGHARGEAVVHA